MKIKGISSISGLDKLIGNTKISHIKQHIINTFHELNRKPEGYITNRFTFRYNGNEDILSNVKN